MSERLDKDTLSGLDDAALEMSRHHRTLWIEACQREILQYQQDMQDLASEIERRKAQQAERKRGERTVRMTIENIAYEGTWTQTDFFCPTCGTKGVWRDGDSEADEVGHIYFCPRCSHAVHLLDAKLYIGQIEDETRVNTRLAEELSA